VRSLLQDARWVPLQCTAVIPPFWSEPAATHALRCHPATPSRAVQAIEVGLRRCAGAALELRYVMAGDVAAVSLPAARHPQFADRLWEHTCFEAFLADAQGGYCELNFSPSTQWAIYRFSAYRNDMSRVEVTRPPQMRTQLAGGRYTMDVRIELSEVPALYPDATWKAALSAVIEALDATRSYWALAHPCERPDFHHPDGFVLELPPPSANEEPQ
jgi:hypothetical protein